jgi:hypothetical protein
VQYLPKGAQVFRLLEVQHEAATDGISDKYDAAILARRDLSDLAKVLFIVVSSLHHSGASPIDRCKPGQWYATVLGTHRTRVVEALNQLRAINAVAVTHHRRESDHYKAPSLIEPLPSSFWLPDRKRQKPDLNSIVVDHSAKSGLETIQNPDMKMSKKRTTQKSLLQKSLFQKILIKKSVAAKKAPQ